MNILELSHIKKGCGHRSASLETCAVNKTKAARKYVLFTQKNGQNLNIVAFDIAMCTIPKQSNRFFVMLPTQNEVLFTYVTPFTFYTSVDCETSSWKHSLEKLHDFSSTNTKP
jgi:hypothetical protein